MEMWFCAEENMFVVKSSFFTLPEVVPSTNLSNELE